MFATAAAFRVFLIPLGNFGDIINVPFPATLIFDGDTNLWRALKNHFGLTYGNTDLVLAPYGPAYYYPMSLYLKFVDALGLLHYEVTDSGAVLTGSVGTLIAVKLPFLLAELITAFVLLRLLGGTAGRNAVLLWILSPAVLLASYIAGHIDTIVALGIAAALYLGQLHLSGKRDYNIGPFRIGTDSLSLLSLSLAGAVKLYPLLLVLPFALILGDTLGSRWRLAAWGFLPFFFAILPFLPSSEFVDSVLFSPHTSRLTHVTLGSLALFPLVYTLLLVWLALHIGERSLRVLTLASLATMLAMFAAIEPQDPQRHVPLIMLMAVAVALNPRLLPAYLVINAYCLILPMSFGLDAGALAILSPTLGSLPSPREYIEGLLDWDQVMMYAVTLTVMAGVVTIWLAARDWGLNRTGLRVWQLSLVGLMFPLYVGGNLLTGVSGIYGFEPPNPVAETPLRNGPISQPFVAVRDNLMALDVFFTAGSQNTSHDLQLVLRSADGDGAPLRTGTMRAPGHTDAGYKRFGFDELPHSRGQGYVLEISLMDRDETSPVAVGQLYTRPAADSAIQNNAPLPGPIRFRDVYKTPWRSILQDAQDTISRHKDALLSVLGVVSLGFGLLWWATVRSSPLD